jgi:hypothetical protein
VDGADSTPTHWDIPFDGTTTAELRGVTTDEVGGPLPATLTVWVKSSAFGNMMVTATRIDMTADYTFDYTPPMTACGTTIVAYIELGNEANNDLTDDGIDNGSGTAAAGFRILDEFGDVVECPVSVDDSAWGRVKAQYR